MFKLNEKDRVVLSNNKIELVIAKDVLKDRFIRWG